MPIEEPFWREAACPNWWVSWKKTSYRNAMYSGWLWGPENSESGKLTLQPKIKPGPRQMRSRFSCEQKVDARWCCSQPAFQTSSTHGNKHVQRPRTQRGTAGCRTHLKNLALGVGTEPWQTRLPALLKVCHHIVNVKKTGFSNGKSAFITLSKLTNNTRSNCSNVK